MHVWLLRVDRRSGGHGLAGRDSGGYCGPEACGGAAGQHVRPRVRRQRLHMRLFLLRLTVGGATEVLARG
jgi:hypothetical protein